MNSFSKLRCLARNFFGWWTLQVTLAVLVGVLVWLFGLFVAVVFWEDAAKHVSQGLGIPEKEGSKNEVLKFLGIGMGGLLIALQAVIANKRAKAMEKTANAQARATEEQAKANLHTEQGQRQERLKNAIEHLGHDKDSVRLGGAYELFHLARDTKDLRQTVLDILCAHIRWTTGEERYWKKQSWKPSEEVQSLLTLLFVRQYEVFQDLQINLRGSWLNGADLYKARLDGAFMEGVSLKKAILREANLREARLVQAHLQAADLFGANMQAAVLERANLQSTHLVQTGLQKAWLVEADLQAADLRLARLHGANLRKAHMQAAEFYMTGLQEAEIEGICLQGIKHRLGANWLPWASAPFAERIKESIGRESDLSGIIFEEGLQEDMLDSLVKGLPDAVAKDLRQRLSLHVGSQESNELPRRHRANIGFYTSDSILRKRLNSGLPSTSKPCQKFQRTIADAHPALADTRHGHSCRCPRAVSPAGRSIGPFRWGPGRRQHAHPGR